MVDFLKKYSIPWISNRIAKKNGIKRYSTPYSEARKILVVFTSSGNQKIALLKVLQSKMEKEDKEVSFLYLLLRDEDRPDVRMDQGMLRLDKHEVSLFGKITNEKAEKLLNQTYDYLIHADLEYNIYTDLLISKSKAHCRIGRYFDNHDNFYDLMVKIKEGESLKFLIDQLYFYTKAL